MKKVMLVFLVLAVSLGQIRQWSEGDELVYHVNVVNEGTRDIKDLRVSVFIPDLPLFRITSRFDLGDGDNTAKFIVDPLAAKPGYYLTKITLSSSEKGTLDTKYIYTIV